jgi:O-antigen/teichoic acid export membrane protein
LDFAGPAADATGIEARVNRAVSSVSADPVDPAAPNAVPGVARGSAVNMLGAAATAVLSFVIVAVVTRGMNKLDAGVVFTATSLFILVESLARLGADIGIVHHLSGALAFDSDETKRGGQPAARDRTATNVLLASLLPVTAAATLAGLVLLAITVPLQHLVVGTHRGHSSHGMAIVVVLAVTMPFAAAYDVMTAATRALGSVRPTVLVERLLRPLIQLAGVGVAVALNANVAVVVAAWTLPYLVCAVVMSGWLRLLMRRAKVPLWSSDWRSVVRPVWSFTGPRAVASVLQSALQRCDPVHCGWPTRQPGGGLLGATAAAPAVGAG